MAMIGKKMLSLFIFTLLSHGAHAAFQAAVDRSELSEEETLSLQLSLSGSGDDFSPKFDAPDFEVLNQFESSQYSSVFANGKLENQSKKIITYVLHPKKSGALRIRNIQNSPTQEKYADITIQVSAGPPGGRPTPQGERPELNNDQKNFFMKAEISKAKIYKGEQVIVSYYLYRRTRVTFRDVMQYPTFQGFIREDLEMPILSGRPDFEAVSLGGIPFERALLARYALYPIRQGKLKIDGLSVRADYIPRNQATDDLMEDPFFQFFSQVTPRTGTSRSDPIQVDVLPLPEEGKSELFTGGVGDFQVEATTDTQQAKTNAPVNLKVTVRGKGNSSLIEFPAVNWPKNLKLYESQGKPKTGAGGVTEKTFEVVLIPLEAGDLVIPPIEFDFFNPESRSYVRKKTNPISIRVAQGEGTAYTPTAQPDLPVVEGTINSKANPGKQGFGALRIKDTSFLDSTSGFLGQPWWKWVSWGGLLVFLSFLVLIVFDQLKKQSLLKIEIIKRKQQEQELWSDLKREIKALDAMTSDSAQYTAGIEKVVEKLADHLHQMMDARLAPIATRSLVRRELAKLLTDSILTESILTKEQWNQLESVFVYCDSIRYSAGDQSEQKTKLLENVKLAETVAVHLKSKNN